MSNKEAIEQIKEYADHILLHSHDEHVAHFVTQIQLWANKLNNDGWISVDESLPEAGEAVLILINDNTGFLTGWISDDGDWAVGNIYVSWDFLSAFDSGLEVTHWRPLPPAPLNDEE